MSNVLERAVKRVRSHLSTRYPLSLPFEGEPPVFVAGVGRTGSTWVSSIINYDNDYRYIFEPFRNDKVPLCAPLRRRQYLSRDNTDPDFLKIAEKVLRGTLRNAWTDQLNRRFLSSRRLIKDIRANLLLKWLHVNFPGTRFVLLFRHPCAYANSRVKQGYSADPFIEDMLDQPDLVDRHFRPFVEMLGRQRSPFEGHIMQWCMEYLVPVREFSQEEIHLSFYENFCNEPEDEIRRLFGFLEKGFDVRVLEGLRVASSVSREYSAIVTGESLTGGWRKDISPGQEKRSREILSAFGLEGIYGTEGVPDREEACRLLARREPGRRIIP